jgi:polyhydroxyalkanoate synthesis regulator phasin
MWGASERLRNLRVLALGRAELSPVRAAEMVAQGKLTQEEADRMTGQVRNRGTSAAGGG